MEPIHADQVKEALFQACHAQCPHLRRHMMDVLEGFDRSPLQYIVILTRIVDIHDIGATCSQPCRQLAAIILKNEASKYWKSDDHSAGQEAVRTHLKQFLASYVDEPDCRVARQLHDLAAKIARICWPEGWRDIFCSVVQTIQKDEFLSAYRAASCLYLLCEELQRHSKQDCKLHRHFLELCIKIFVALSKLWATKLKTLQAQLASPSSSSPRSLEALLAMCNILSRTMSIVLNTAFVQLQERCGCFGCFWQTFLAALKVFTGYLRASRPAVRKLYESPTSSFPSSPCFPPSPSSVLLDSQTELEKVEVTVDHYLEEDDDEVMPPAPLCRRGIIATTYLLTKMVRTLAELPASVLCRYPLKAFPLLQPFVPFFCHHLHEEECSNTRFSSTPNCEEKEVLPLHAVSLAGLRFLATLLTAPVYENSHLHFSNPDKSVACFDAMEEEEAESASQRVQEMRRVFFSRENCLVLLRTLTSTFLPLTPAQLSLWTDNPEDYFALEQDPGGEESSAVRAAAVQVFKGLVRLESEAVLEEILPALLDYEKQKEAIMNPQPSSLAYWDSMYLCAGLAVDLIAQRLDASYGEASLEEGACEVESENEVNEEKKKCRGATKWLVDGLGPLLNLLLVDPAAGAWPAQKQQLLRARLLWLLATYLPFFDISVQQVVLRFLSDLVACEARSDVVVKLFTVRALDKLLQVPSFQPALLPPCAMPALSGLCRLVWELKQSEVRLGILQTSADLIRLLNFQNGSMEQLLIPLSEYLVRLWLFLEPSDMVRRGVLEVFRALVETAGGVSHSVEGFYLPVLLDAFGVSDSRYPFPALTPARCAKVPFPRPTRPANTCSLLVTVSVLLDEALAFWLALVRTAPSEYLRCGACPLAADPLLAILGPPLHHLLSRGSGGAQDKERMDLEYAIVTTVNLLQAYAVQTSPSGSWLADEEVREVVSGLLSCLCPASFLNAPTADMGSGGSQLYTLQRLLFSILLQSREDVDPNATQYVVDVLQKSGILSSAMQHLLAPCPASNENGVTGVAGATHRAVALSVLAQLVCRQQCEAQQSTTSKMCLEGLVAALLQPANTSSEVIHQLECVPGGLLCLRSWMIAAWVAVTQASASNETSARLVLTAVSLFHRMLQQTFLHPQGGEKVQEQWIRSVDELIVRTGEEDIYVEPSSETSGCACSSKMGCAAGREAADLLDDGCTCFLQFLANSASAVGVRDRLCRLLASDVSVAQPVAELMKNQLAVVESRLGRHELLELVQASACPELLPIPLS